MEQDRLALAQAGLEDEVAPDRAGDLGQRGGVREADAGRDGQQLAHGHGHLLGIPTTGEERADLVADRPAGVVGARAERGDRAADLEARQRGGALGWGVVALALLDVRAVHARGDDVDEHLALAGHGRVDLGRDEDVGVTGLVDRDGAHASTLESPSAVSRSGCPRWSRS